SFDIPVNNDGSPYIVQLTVTDQAGTGNSRVVTQQVLQSIDASRDAVPQTIPLSSYFSGLAPAFSGLDWADPNRTLHYAVSNVNKKLESPTVDANTGLLTMNYVSGGVGTDTITVTVTDTNPAAQAGPAADKSESITSTFNVLVRGPILTTTTLQIHSADVYYWNSPMALEYVIANQGPVAAGPFDVAVYLSPAQRAINPATDRQVATFHVERPGGVGIPANDDTGLKTVSVTLPLNYIPENG